jgi:hypothetical protein
MINCLSLLYVGTLFFWCLFFITIGREAPQSNRAQTSISLLFHLMIILMMGLRPILGEGGFGLLG